jgi:hypothetical protein
MKIVYRKYLNKNVNTYQDIWRKKLIKSIFMVTALASTVMLMGCQEKTEADESSRVLSTPQTLESTVVSKKGQLLCKSASPVIQDKSKIKKMLTDSGKITADMSEEMANKVVNNYIKSKREAFKRCKK